ncbi:MAG: hypothetical protein QOC78_261 [Solirubrobacteraceae bacterium]|jgi:hypothetical protein|nr:hypothetical protein [Solirubrobacteraceae bacterium]
MNRRISAVAGTVTAVVVAGSVTTVLAASLQGPKTPGTTPSPRVSGNVPATAVDSRLARSFGVFRQPANAAREATTQRTQFGTNHALDRFVATSTGRVTLVPGSAGVCIVVPDQLRSDFQSAACESTARTLTGHLVLSERSQQDDSLLVSYGLVPDGIDKVTLDGSSPVQVAVKQNVWTAPHPGDATTVSYSDATGHAVRLPLP